MDSRTEEKNVDILEVGEQELLSELVIQLIAQYPELPGGITPQYQSLKEGESIGVFTLQGAAYLKQDILGGFQAQFPFALVYRSMPGGNGQRIDSQKILDGLGRWMEQTDLPELTDGRVIERLERTTTTVLQASYDNGVQDYKCSMNLIYRKDD